MYSRKKPYFCCFPDGNNIYCSSLVITYEMIRIIDNTFYIITRFPKIELFSFDSKRIYLNIVIIIQKYCFINEFTKLLRYFLSILIFISVQANGQSWFHKSEVHWYNSEKLEKSSEKYADFRFRNAFNSYFGGIDTFYAPYIRMNGKMVIKKSYQRDLFPENNIGLVLLII